MLNWKQQNKIFKSVNKIGPIEILRAPSRIARECVINAKTDEARSRLVQTTEILAIEHMKRLHVRGYEYPRDDKKYDYKAPTMGEWFKNSILKLFK